MENLQTETFDIREAVSHFKTMHERVIAAKKASGDENVIFPEYATVENAENAAAATLSKPTSREIN